MSGQVSIGVANGTTSVWTSTGTGDPVLFASAPSYDTARIIVLVAEAQAQADQTASDLAAVRRMMADTGI